MFNTTQKDNWPDKNTPDISHAFDTARDPLIAAQIAQLEHTQAQQRAEQHGSTMVKNYAPMPHPTPPGSTGYAVNRENFDQRWQDEQARHAHTEQPLHPQFNSSSTHAMTYTSNTTQAKSNPPVQTLRSGAIALKIWENEGKNGVHHNISLEKSYLAQDGKYYTSKSFNMDDLKKIQQLIPQAEQAIQHLRQRQYDQQQHMQYQPQQQNDTPQPQQTMTQAELQDAHNNAMQHGQIPEQQHTRTMTHER